MKTALSYLNQTESHPVKHLDTVSGLDVTLTDDMRRRMRALVPDEALPEGDTIRLSDDKAFCMKEMVRSMQNNMAETAWPKTQYLWSLHPIMTWVNDKAGLLYARAEAPMIGISNGLAVGEEIFIVSGSIPNMKSTPLVDEWFGLLYKDGSYVDTLSMNDVIQRTHIRGTGIPNTNSVTEAEAQRSGELLGNVVEHAKTYLKEKYDDYQQRMNPLLDKEVDKLIALQEKQHEYNQLTFFDQKRKFEERERSIDELFDQFVDWVKDTLTIQNNPYIRIAAVLTGVLK